MEVLAKAKRELPDAEVVILTGHNTAKAAVLLAMQAGATTYLTKPLDITWNCGPSPTRSRSRSAWPARTWSCKSSSTSDSGSKGVIRQLTP